MRYTVVCLALASAMVLATVSGCATDRGSTAFVAYVKGTYGRVVVVASRPSRDVLLLGEMGRFINLSPHDQLWSDNGRVVYFEGEYRDPLTWLCIATAAGDQRRVANVEGLGLSSLSISRDGRRVLIAYGDSRVVETPFLDGTRQDTVRFMVIESIDVATGARNQLASVDNMSVSRASYSPDGRRIAFVGRTDNPMTHHGVYVMSSSGRDMRRLTDLNNEMNPFEPLRWSPDGKKILYSLETLFIDDITHYDDIFVLDVASAESTNLTRSPDADDGQYSWSPDGRRVAFYESEAPGIGAIYVMNPDGANRKKVIGNAGSPSWADNRHVLASGVAYDETSGRWLGTGILRVDVETGEVSVVVPLQDGYGSLSYPLWIDR